MKSFHKRIALVLLAFGAASSLGSMAWAGPVYFVEVGPERVLSAQTLGMNSNERLRWYLEETGKEADPAIVQLQRDYSEEIVAILNVGGAIEEYVTQTTDNDFYLNHNAFGAEDVNGSAFFDSRCRFFPADDQVIIHGHNMKGGAVFGRLNNYRDISYLQTHPLITLQTLSGTEYYVPYAVTDVNVDMSAENYFLEIVWNFEPASFEHYTGYLKEKSYYEIPVDAAFGDRLLTLSTCSYVYSDSRLLICARKLRSHETPEQMAGLVAQSSVSGVKPDTIAPYTGGGDYESLSGRDLADLRYETEADIGYVKEAVPDDLIVE
jgi:sortase B